MAGRDSCKTRTVVHIANIDISPNTGMGRVAYHWRKAFIRKGYNFVHIGTSHAAIKINRRLFPYLALIRLCRMDQKPTIILVHEPCAGIFALFFRDVVLFSHGIERRAREISQTRITLIDRLLIPLSPIWQADMGWRFSKLQMVLNSDDRKYAMTHYRKKAHDILFYRNGVNEIIDMSKSEPKSSSYVPAVSSPVPSFRLLFLGSWLKRKGIDQIVDVSVELYNRNVAFEWVLAGTGANSETVMADFPRHLQKKVVVVPSFSLKDEASFYHCCDLFILPSIFEGQPLALLQAMANSLCCIATDSCGQADLIHHGLNGFLFKPGDYLALADLIQRLSADPTLRLSIGRNAQSSVKNRSWESIADEIVAEIEEHLTSANSQQD